MTQEDQWADWNWWCESKIAKALNDYTENFLEEMGKVLVHERQSMREHVEKKIGEVRTELKGGNVEQLARKTNVG